MPDDAPSRRDRYDVSGNAEAEFVDKEQLILVNKQGIIDLKQLQLAEEALLAKAYFLLTEKLRPDTAITNDLIRYAHQLVFEELYAWAGRWRTVNISKPGVTWPPWGFVPELMKAFQREVLSKYSAWQLQDDDAFCRGVAEIQSEFLVVHPFREGNARAIKIATDLLSIQTGRPLLAYDQTDAGRDAYIVAASQAFSRNYDPMIEIIRRALATAWRGP